MEGMQSLRYPGILASLKPRELFQGALSSKPCLDPPSYPLLDPKYP